MPKRQGRGLTVTCVSMGFVVLLAVSVAASQGYRVRSGDCLSSIGRKYHVSVSDLCRANRLSAKSELNLGQKLVIPGREDPGQTPERRKQKPETLGQTCVVRPGDSPHLIAKRHGIPLPKFLAANGLSERSVLRIGQKLRVPGKQADSPKQIARRAAPPASGPVVGYLRRDRADVRIGPSVKYDRLLLAGKGTRVVIEGKALGWCRVTLPNRRSGWVHWESLKADRLETVRRIAFAPLPRKKPGAGSPSKVVAKGSPAFTEKSVEPTKAGSPAASGNGQRRKEVVAAKTETSPASSLVTPRLRGDHSSPSSTGGKAAWVSGSNANVRSAPSLSASTIAQLDMATRVSLLDARHGWYQVRLPDGRTGWMAAWVLNLNASPQVARDRGGRATAVSAAKSTASGGRNASLVRLAMGFRGVRYRRGGTTSRGLDCSGLVYRVMQMTGRDGPRSSASLYHLGTPVSRENLKPGDMVFFRRTYRRGISHVGIYVGNNNFIHATRPGGRVTITSLDHEYYQSRYAGARRLK